MLTDLEKLYVADQLMSAVGGAAAVRANLVAGLPGRLQLLLDDALLPGPMIMKALQLCLDDAYVESPPALSTFLRTLLPGDPRLAIILRRIVVPPPAGEPSPDAFEAIVLDNKLPFLGRTRVRQYLRALLQDLPKQPTIVINGRSKGGKTYTIELIGHARRYHSSILPCHIELSPKQGASIGPSELASDIVTQLGGDPGQIPPRNTNLDRWAQELANWIVSVAGKSHSKCWIILDGFNKDELRTDTLLLIVKLSRVLTLGAAQRMHRLILMDFDHTSLPVPPGSIAVEVINPVRKATVASFVEKIVPAGQKSGPIVETVMNGLSDPVENLPELARRLSDLSAVLGE